MNFCIIYEKVLLVALTNIIAILPSCAVPDTHRTTVQALSGRPMSYEENQQQAFTVLEIYAASINPLQKSLLRCRSPLELEQCQLRPRPGSSLAGARNADPTPATTPPDRKKRGRRKKKQKRNAQQQLELSHLGSGTTPAATPPGRKKTRWRDQKKNARQQQQQRRRRDVFTPSELFQLDVAPRNARVSRNQIKVTHFHPAS